MSCRSSIAKLDRYMERKYRSGDMTHLLIDRFRFDSFAPDSDEEGSNLLTRFGHSVFLFFVITPPEQLVERAWKRGLEFGRYKAVDDTLAHAVEAYTGMPNVFFTWVRRSDKRIHFEFLDNSVPLGSARAPSHSATTRRSTCSMRRACSTSTVMAVCSSMPPGLNFSTATGNCLPPSAARVS